MSGRAEAVSANTTTPGCVWIRELMSTRTEYLRAASTRQGVEVARAADVDIQVGLSDAEASRTAPTAGCETPRASVAAHP